MERLMTGTTIHPVGSIGDAGGRMDVSYLADHGGMVILRVSVPGDRRRSDITVHTGVAGLKQLVGKLEATVEIAKVRQCAQEAVAQRVDGVSVTVLGTTVIVPNAIYKKLSELMIAGDNDQARRVISTQFPALADKAVSDLAFLIYKQVRPRA
jgi:hypothetical protein